ncbi:PKD domain-containing protein [Thermoflexibacter ruber]|uniref:Gliding motility-associated C-terminal domain-containing protein n=1 Tax=Thermoflexibacter ruber TaxID=1003 RepID=A0A1I2JZM1_9BACT|nr:PKD domain-containing protein [Thermoflexibacter ruber]SFF59478.1 gliding motility-associated C-terminal domain-containing protein [Thermoflexibacter ruber]
MRKFALFSFIYLLLLVIFLSPSSYAATFNVPAGDVKALINAILSANTNKDASNTINLARNSVYELTQPYGTDVSSFNIKHGNIGLPLFKDGKTIIINGNGSVIRRTTSSVSFRIISLDIYSKVTIENLTIENGLTSGAGGGIYKVTGGELSLSNVKFINNEAGERGGGLYIGSRNNAIIKNCEFLNNKCVIKGGGIYNVLSDLEINNTKFIGNSGTSNEMEGGGLFVDGARSDGGRSGKISIVKCVFSSNKANVSSGGLQLFLYNNNEGIIDQCDISNNTLLGNGKNSSFGGGVYLSGGTTGSNTTNNVIVRITNSIIDNNTSVSQGGGLWFARIRIEIENSTITNNKGATGGISAGSSVLSLKNCTIANNVSTTSTGGITSSTSVSASNCIFFNNIGVGGKHHFGSTGTLIDLGNNIQFKSGEADKYMPNTVRTVNPLLLPLADNGGPTRTMALQKGSPAIDAGNNCTPTDQRGQKRVGKCDIGAFEYIPNTSADFTPNTPQNITTGQIINFQDASTNSPTAWEWTITGGTATFVNGTNKNSQNPQVRFDTQGVFSVTLTVSNVSGSSSKTVENFITVTSPLPKPIADFTPTTLQEITVGQHVKFYDRSKNNPTSWQWTVTGGRHKYIWNTSATFKDPRVQFDEVGLYTISMTVSNEAGSDTKTVTQMVKVNPIVITPVANFSPSTAQTLTVGQSINFQDLSTNVPTTWEWTITGGAVTFLNSTTINSQNPQVRFDSEGKYTVALRATNSAGSHTKTLTEYITVNKAAPTPPPVDPTSPLAPIADFTPNTFQEITVGQHIKFYDRSKNNPTSWQWTVTGGKHKYIWNTSATFKDPRIQFDEVGLYTISVTVSNAAGSNTKTITQMVKVNASMITQQNILSPTSLVSAPNISAPVNLQITVNNLNEVNLQWQDTSTDHEGYKIYRKEEEREAILVQTLSKAQVETLSFSDQSKLNPDTKYDYYVVTFGKGIERQSNIATIHTYPTQPILEKIEYQCASNKYAIKINSLNKTPRYKKLHQWEQVTKTQLIEQNLLQIDASKDSKIKIIAVGKTGLESMPLEINLEKREQPKAQIIGEVEREVCATHTLLSAEKVENAVYEWQLDGKIIENLKGSEVKVSQSGKYELIIKKDGCQFASNPVQVSFFALKTPEIDASNNEVKFCKKGQIAIKEAQKEVKYQWLDEQDKVVGEGTTLSVEKTGIYKVVAISDLGCQEVSVPVKVSVGQPIVMNTQIIQPTCFNSNNGKILISTQDKQNIKIKLGDEVKEGNAVSFESLRAGVYHIIAETAYGCYKEIKLEIRNPEKFKLKTSENELTTNKFTSVQLQAEGAVEYEWFPKEGLDNPYIANPKANPTQTTTYKVVGKNKNGCESSAEIKVNVIDTKEILPSKVLSPNGDGVNDTWQVENIEFFPDAEVIVYNRFGQEVFHTTGYQNNWDGSINITENAPSPSTFYFVIKIPQINKHISGSLTIMR